MRPKQERSFVLLAESQRRCDLTHDLAPVTGNLDPPVLRLHRTLHFLEYDAQQPSADLGLELRVLGELP